VNPRAGLVYSPTHKLKIKVLYGRAYLSPSPYRQYQHYGSFQTVNDAQGITGLRSDFWRLPSENLEPQRIRTYETGFSYILLSNLILSANGYYNDMDDILSSESFTGQTFKGVPVNIIERPDNKGNAISYGGTVRINVKKSWPSFILNSYLAYTYTNGEIEGRQIPFSAKNTIKSIVDFNYGRVSTSARFIFRSKSYHRSLTDDSGNLLYSDPYGIINLSGRYTLIEKQKFETGIFVKINNLLNSKYYNVPIGGAESIRMAPQDPIRFLLGVQMKFL
jgi:outer membrane receptor protein involved in Fe transport